MLGHADIIHNLQINGGLSSTLMVQVVTDMLSALLHSAVFSALYLANGKLFFGSCCDWMEKSPGGFYTRNQRFWSAVTNTTSTYNLLPQITIHVGHEASSYYLVRQWENHKNLANDCYTHALKWPLSFAFSSH